MTTALCELDTVAGCLQARGCWDDLNVCPSLKLNTIAALTITNIKTELTAQLLLSSFNSQKKFCFPHTALEDDDSSYDLASWQRPPPPGSAQHAPAAVNQVYLQLPPQLCSGGMSDQTHAGR